MLRQGGGRVLQSARSGGSHLVTSSVRSLSPHMGVLPSTALPLAPASASQEQQQWRQSSRSQCSIAQCTIYTKNTKHDGSRRIPRRWKSNLHKRAAQALGKNNMKNKKSPEPPVIDNDDSSSSSSSSSSEGAASQSVFSEMMKNASSAMAADGDDAKPSDGTKGEQVAEEGTEEKGSVSESAAPEIPPTMTPVGHLHEFAPRIVVVGVGGGGGNAVNNMIASQLHGVDFLTLNTDAQHLSTTLTTNRIQIGSTITSGLGCGANPEAGRLAAEESRQQITDLLSDAHMVFITAGMGGGTGTGAAPVVAEVCYNLGILTVGVVTKPFRFEGTQRMRLADEGILRLREVVDTLIVIPNQNLFHLANDQTSFVDSFAMADNVLLAGVKSITDLMTTPGLINLDFADVQSVMSGMGNAILGTGQSSFDDLKDKKKQIERAVVAAEMALANPLLGSDMDIGTAKGMLVNITGGKDMTLFEVDRAAQLITERVQDDRANIIFGSAYDETLDGSVRVSVVATGIEEVTKDDPK